MSDLFQDAVPDAYIEAVATVMLKANWHTYQILTKRAHRLQQLLASKLRHAGEARHIWWGVSVEDQKYGVPRIDNLRSAPASTRFLSIEPLLEDLGALDLSGIHWVIVGGESGPGARPMRAPWVEAIKEQCETAHVAFFFKQWGGVQKSKTGRLLNGRTHDAMPGQFTTSTPPRAVRQTMLHDLAPLTRQWSTTPLVHLVRRQTIVA